MKTKILISFFMISLTLVISCSKDDNNENDLQQYIKVSIKGASDNGMTLNESFVADKMTFLYDSTSSNIIKISNDTTTYDIVRCTGDSLQNLIRIIFQEVNNNILPVAEYQLEYNKVIDNKKVSLIAEFNMGQNFATNPNQILNFSYNKNTHIVKANYKFNGEEYQVYGDFVIKLKEINK